MNIRPATQNDLEQIVEIFNQAIENGNSNAYTEKVKTSEKQQWFESHTHQYFILVVEENENIIGWTSISPYRKDRQALAATAEISYYIHTDYQRKGIGKLLVNEAINLAIKKRNKKPLCNNARHKRSKQKPTPKHKLSNLGTPPKYSRIPRQNLRTILLR